MLNIMESPGDHRSLLFDLSTRSMLGEFLNTVCQPVSRRLVTSQRNSIKNNNRIVQEECSRHRIQERLDAIDKMTKHCNYPRPKWLEKIFLTLYSQMTEIRRYAEKKCRKILTPVSKFSPTIQMWYDRIHIYLQLIRLKEGKTNKAKNVFRLARKHNIQHPEKLSREELEDGLQLAVIWKKDLRKQAGKLRNAHLRECLITAQVNNKSKM